MSLASLADKAREGRVRRNLEEEREALSHTGDWRRMKRLLYYLRPRWKWVGLAVVLSTINALLILLPMILVKRTIDAYIMTGDFQGVIRMCLLVLGAQFLIFLLEGVTMYLIAWVGQSTMRDLRMELFQHIQGQPLKFFDKNPVGRLITRLTSDVNVLNELFAQGVIGIFQQLFSLVAIVGMLFYYNWRLTLWVMLVVPLLYLAAWNFRRHVQVFYRLTRVRLSRLNAFMQENITGMKTVQSNTRERSQYEIFKELNGAYRNSQINTVFHYAMFFPLIEFISALGLAIVLWRGGVLFLEGGAAIGGAITVGTFALFIQGLERFFWPIRDLSEKYNLIQAAVAASERLFNLLDTKPAIQDVDEPAEVKPLAQGVEFRDVWFAYNDEDWVLKGVSFKVSKGETVALIGPTGSGKTTITNLLCRFYEIQHGEILIDGVNIQEMRQEELRRKIAIVLQDVFLFYGSVSDNIRLGEKEITDEKIQEVAREIGADGFIQRLPNGYESGVQERGATLSTGQKQLLSFARALAFDPEILILDEATSNIDTESEQQIQRAVGKLCADRTALVIAHRLSTIQRSDKILVLHHGHLIEQGSHEELLRKDGLYRRLYELQYKEELAG